MTDAARRRSIERSLLGIAITALLTATSAAGLIAWLSYTTGTHLLFWVNPFVQFGIVGMLLISALCSWKHWRLTQTGTGYEGW